MPFQEPAGGPNFYLHRALGNLTAAEADQREALAINRNFSFLHAPTAERAVADLSRAG